MQVRNALFTTLLSLAALSGCGHHSSSHSDPHGEALFEVEPNGNTFNADYLGEVRPGDYLEVQGHITECCFDDFDGFALYATEPVSVTISLHELTSGIDLDFGIYIPEVDAFVDAFETTHNPEIGVFDQAGPGEFHIVVNAFHGNGDYLLRIEVSPLSYGLENNQALTPSNLAAHRVGMSESAMQRFKAYAHPERAGRQMQVEVQVLEK